jgi:DNA-binding response OmpR family regulator
MKPAKILIVEDEENIRIVLKRMLASDGYQIDTAANGAEAIDLTAQTNYDLLLLDLYMEPVDGMQVFSALRKHNSDTTVMILTARSSTASAIEALRLGAFDYLQKPIGAEELRQRVRECLQHHQEEQRRKRMLFKLEELRQTMGEMDEAASAEDSSGEEVNKLQSGGIEVDLGQRTATCNGSSLDLTTTEFNLLVCLMDAAPQPLSPRKLVNYALNYDCEDSEAREIVKWHIYQLRQKVEADPAKPALIRTVRFQGYMWGGQ